MPIMRFPLGRPKALTLSYDDGVEQDIRLMELLDRYQLHCTFNLNSGCYAAEGTRWPEGTIHRRLPRSRVLPLYANPAHEVAVHCLTHANLIELPADQVVYEVMQDRVNLERDFGTIIRGMAYPFGTYNDTVADALRTCGIQYARTVESSHAFGIPQDWLRLKPTCHHADPMLDQLCDDFLTVSTRFCSRVFYLWGHAYEFEADGNWQVMEAFCQKMSGHDDIWYCTNIALCEYVKAFQSLIYAADGSMVRNPSTQSVWIEVSGRIVECPAGSTVRL